MTNESREVLKWVFSGKQIAFSMIAGILITAHNPHTVYYTWWGDYVMCGILSTIAAFVIILGCRVHLPFASLWHTKTKEIMAHETDDNENKPNGDGAQ